MDGNLLILDVTSFRSDGTKLSLEIVNVIEKSVATLCSGKKII